jgi:ATP-dependent protease HslVU (ClpYQ) peptidase subunit
MEIIGTLLIVGALITLVYVLTERASRGLGEQVLTHALSGNQEIIKNEDFSNLAYEIKFANFIQLARFSKGGEIRIPDWDSLGETEAERARNLLLVRDNHIKLVVEGTGEVIAPQTAETIAKDLATKN